MLFQNILYQTVGESQITLYIQLNKANPEYTGQPDIYPWSKDAEKSRSLLELFTAINMCNFQKIRAIYIMGYDPLDEIDDVSLLLNWFRDYLKKKNSLDTEIVIYSLNSKCGTDQKDFMMQFYGINSYATIISYNDNRELYMKFISVYLTLLCNNLSEVDCDVSMDDMAGCEL